MLEPDIKNEKEVLIEKARIRNITNLELSKIERIAELQCMQKRHEAEIRQLEYKINSLTGEIEEIASMTEEKYADRYIRECGDLEVRERPKRGF